MSFLTSSNYVVVLNPEIDISPADGYTSAVKLLNVVDLPAPLTPNNAKHSP